ncbi:MAG: glycosyltransferase [Sandaracinaceae bacterium]
MSRREADVALLLPNVEGGGAERVMVQIASGLAERGHRVDLVLGRARGRYLAEIPTEVTVVELGVDRALACLPGLVKHIRRSRPRALLSTMNHVNPVAIAGARLSATGTRVVVREASNLSGQMRDVDTRRGRLTPLAIRMTYPWAHEVVAVSEAAKRDLVVHSGLDPHAIEVVYNPVDFDALEQAAAQASGHPWLDDGARPVILAVGRLSAEKDFPVLLEAFARLVSRSGPRLVLCGEGPERARLEARIAELGIEDDVQLVGFVDNPYAYIARAKVFTLPSRWEGLPNTLIHALALGARVVATDCPGGSAEILEGGRWGALVPVGRADELAVALGRALAEPESVHPDAAWRKRFEAGEVVRRYEALLGLGG